MRLAELRNRFLFELRPDLFPDGFLTPLECHLWVRFYEDKAAKRPAR